jgi:hypothetical protein
LNVGKNRGQQQGKPDDYFDRIIFDAWVGVGGLNTAPVCAEQV